MSESSTPTTQGVCVLSRFGNLLGFIYASGLSFYLLVRVPPPWSDRVGETAFTALGVTTSALLFIHFLRGATAFSLLYGRQGLRSRIFGFLWYTMTLLAALSCVPSIAGFTTPALFVVYAIAFTYSRMFSIENILNQNALYYLSIGHACAWPCFGLGADECIRFQSVSLWGFFISLGLLMHSAGWEKVRSDTWQRGRGVIEFLSQTHLIRPSVAVLAKLPKPLLVLMSHAVVVGELSLLPSLLFPPLTLAVSLFLAGFASSLFTITDISFIGQNLLCELGTLAYVSLDAGAPKVESCIALGQSVIAFSLVATAFAIHFENAASRLGVKALQHCLSGVAMPIRVFTEAHLGDVKIFRFAAMSGNRSIDVAQVFGQDGTPGPLQRVHPRYFQSYMYLVGRIARKHQAGHPLSDADAAAILDLLYAAVPRSLRRGEVEMRLLLAEAVAEVGAPATWKPFARTTCRHGITANLVLEGT